MKKLQVLMIAALFLIAGNTFAQTAQPATKTTAKRIEKEKTVTKSDAPLKKDGTPDKRFAENKKIKAEGAIDQNVAEVQKLKKDGTPDKRYSENKNLKKDGTPDKRFKTKADSLKAGKKKN